MKPVFQRYLNFLRERFEIGTRSKDSDCEEKFREFVQSNFEEGMPSGLLFREFLETNFVQEKPKKGFSTCISSPPDRENVVLEISFGKFHVAEVSHEPGQPLRIEIYNHPEAKEWGFELEEFLSMLLKAKEALKDLK